jgi:hypothetical protein
MSTKDSFDVGHAVKMDIIAFRMLVHRESVPILRDKPGDGVVIMSWHPILEETTPFPLRHPYLTVPGSFNQG